MVRLLSRYYRSERVLTACTFQVDGVFYVKFEKNVSVSGHKSLGDWIDLKPGMRNRLRCLESCLECSTEYLCATCNRDESCCICFVDANGLVWDPSGSCLANSDGEFLF